MTLEDMNINEVLVRYLRNMAEIERLKSEDLQINTTTDSIEEPRYVEDLSQWEEYRATKEEITRLSEERKVNINQQRQALFTEQRDIRAFLRQNESVPKDKWIRCADDGVYVPGAPANGEPAVRVAPWEHIMETNGQPERARRGVGLPAKVSIEPAPRLATKQSGKGSRERRADRCGTHLQRCPGGAGTRRERVVSAHARKHWPVRSPAQKTL